MRTETSCNYDKKLEIFKTNVCWLSIQRHPDWQSSGSIYVNCNTLSTTYWLLQIQQGQQINWLLRNLTITGETSSFCASLIAGSTRVFLCVDFSGLCSRCVSLSLREFWLRLNEMLKVWTFASRKAFFLLCGFSFSSLENYFGLGTTNVKEKTDHPVSLRWNKKFWTFPKRRVFFWLCIRFICELISHSFAGLN